MEEGVDGVRTLHHDHVTSFLNDFQECKQEDLETEPKINAEHYNRYYYSIKTQYFIFNIA